MKVERYIEKIIVCGKDINSMLYEAIGHPRPPTTYDSFMTLSRVGLIKDSIAKSLASIACMRNRIVREYDAIDDEIVFNNANRILALFPIYISAVLEKTDDLFPIPPEEEL